jgi:hypothetical protein
MLVAYGPKGQPVIAQETALELLQQWSHERLLFCPNCRGIVHVRGGPEKRTQLHFAHQKGECAWSTESESVRHARGKMVLAHWLHEQFPQATVTLEERLPEPNRIADVFLTHADGQRWAIEFQCAPLEIEEWWHRHEAYRKAGIIDVWIVGANRREKQEAFIEAILAEAHEVMFLDPLVTPTRIWLRWPIPRHTAQEWQQTNKVVPALDGWVGRLGYGATLLGRLYEIRFNEHASLMHPVRTAMETRAQLLQTMSEASTVDGSVLAAYLRQQTSEDVIRCVVLPLTRAYLRDPDLLRRYNYGRGLIDQPLSESDRTRVQKGRAWLSSLAQRGFPLERLKGIVNEIPFVGPYAAFAGYAETLISLL